MKRAIYPGSFDPFHHGHLDIATRASQLFSEVFIAIYDKPSKKLLFTTEERVEMARQSTVELSNLSVITYSGLTVDCAQNVGAQTIIRGLRNLADFQFEHQLAWANNHLANHIETCCLFCSKEFAYLSSTILKEVALLGGDYSEWTGSYVRQALEDRVSILETGNFATDSSTLQRDAEVMQARVARSEGKLSYHN